MSRNGGLAIGGGIALSKYGRRRTDCVLSGPSEGKLQNRHSTPSASYQIHYMKHRIAMICMVLGLHYCLSSSDIVTFYVCETQQLIIYCSIVQKGEVLTINIDGGGSLHDPV